MIPIKMHSENKGKMTNSLLQNFKYAFWVFAANVLAAQLGSNVGYTYFYLRSNHYPEPIFYSAGNSFNLLESLFSVTKFYDKLILVFPGVLDSTPFTAIFILYLITLAAIVTRKYNLFWTAGPTFIAFAILEYSLYNAWKV